MRSFLLYRKILLQRLHVRPSRSSISNARYRIPIHCPAKTHHRLISVHIQPQRMAATNSTRSGSLQGLNLSDGDASIKFPGCYPEFNPVDVYRAHIATKLSEITGVDASIVYPNIQWTATLDKGDLTIAVPALRVKGEKPDRLAEKWAKEVRLHTFVTIIFQTRLAYPDLQ